MFCLTPRQLEVVRFVHEFKQENKVSPTYREIGSGCSMATPTAYEMVGKLCLRGVLIRDYHRARTIEISRAMSKQLASSGSLQRLKQAWHACNASDREDFIQYLVTTKGITTHGNQESSTTPLHQGPECMPGEYAGSDQSRRNQGVRGEAGS